MHNGMISVMEEKMSKSVGNIFTVREALRIYGRNAIRMYLFSKHYRSPIEFSSERMEEARASYSRIARVIEEIEKKTGTDEKIVEDEFMREQRSKMVEALDDDFNTSQGLSIVFDLVKEALSITDADRLRRIRALIMEWNYFFGFDFSSKHKDADDFIALEVKLRDEARARKDYAQADEIRDRLNELGIELMDSSEGTSWRWK
jgi:cysteinyl-tRNA synthetase